MFPAGKANCGLWASVIGPYILDGFDISTVPRPYLFGLASKSARPGFGASRFGHFWIF